MKIEAPFRLHAALADEKAAAEFLTELGFKGLTFKSAGEDIIQFRYKDYNKAEVTKYLGNPKPAETSIRYNFGTSGVVAIWPQKMTVVLKNSKRNSTRLTPIETHVPPTEVPVVTPNTPGSPENDDAKVPVTHISEALEKAYKYVQHTDNKGARLTFNAKLWHYLNTTKFGGQMEVPNLRLLKAQGATKMRLRGRWSPAQRLLEVAPRLYNASQNFFVEVFLHEMCHQAVSEIDKVRENENKGHGPQWSKWMRHSGLNPRRFDPNDNTVYMTPNELREHEAKKAEQQALREKQLNIVKENGLQRIMPTVGRPAIILHNGEAYSGVVVCRDGSYRGKRIWAFFTVEQFQKAKESGKLSWKRTYEDHVYLFRGDDSALRSPEWQSFCEQIHAYIVHRRALRKR